MALAAGLHGAVRMSFFRPGKVDQFGVNFKVRVIVDNDIIRPFKKISGKVVIESRFPIQIKFKEILIQFEGLCLLRYSTKIDNRTSFHQGRECILESTKPESEGYQESPVRQVLLADPTDWGKSFYSLSEVVESFPFTLEIPGNPHLPAPFRTPYGTLTYRLVVYMKSTNDIYVEAGDKIMRFIGHHNLLDNVESMKAISMENFFKKSMFTRKKLVESYFSVDSSGFLPEENIPFILHVKNPKCIPLEIFVQLVQTYKYDATGKRDSPKRRYCIVAMKEKEDYEPGPVTTWIDSLPVASGQEPSFTAHQMYHVTYLLQFKVKILNYGTIKGEAPIFIGTTRDPLRILMGNANGLDVPFPGLRRRGSSGSTRSARSHSSAATTFSLPPAYSELSSRIPSMETLPPAYDEVEKFERSQIEDGEITLMVPSMPSSPSPEEDPVGTPEDDDEEEEEEEKEN